MIAETAVLYGSLTANGRKCTRTMGRGTPGESLSTSLHKAFQGRRSFSSPDQEFYSSAPKQVAVDSTLEGRASAFIRVHSRP